MNKTNKMVDISPINMNKTNKIVDISPINMNKTKKMVDISPSLSPEKNYDLVNFSLYLTST